MTSNFNIRAKVLLHPLVLFQIIDAYDRRPKDAKQVSAHKSCSLPVIHQKLHAR